jgi:putrescine aminotransferase
MSDGMNAEAIHRVLRKHGSAGRDLLYSVARADDVEVEAEAAWVKVSSGRKFLDFGSYAVFLLGHRHPAVIERVLHQLNTLPVSSRSFPSGIQALAHLALAEAAPPELSKIMFLNSGAECVEAAAKLARIATSRTALLYLEKSYHGKTFGALSLTDAELFRRPFMPLMPDFERISRSDAASASLAILELRPAGVFVEPIQGEGGIFELADDYLRTLRAACDEAATLLIFDEVQCGLCRSGTMWAFQQADVVPDIILVGKALGGGVMPVSALVAKTSCFRPFDLDPLVHSSTFGGNPLGAAAVVGTMEAIRSENIVAQVQDKGKAVRQMLDGLVARWPNLFTKLTGRGLMYGLHCRKPELSALFIRNALTASILVTPCLTTPHVVRLTPPAILTTEDIAFAAKALDQAAVATSKDDEEE